MATLIFLEEEYIADKILKTDSDIVGYDLYGNIAFSFKGIKDFSLFKLKGNVEFDVEKHLIDDIILDNINMQMQIDSLIQASLGGI